MEGQKSMGRCGHVKMQTPYGVAILVGVGRARTGHPGVFPHQHPDGTASDGVTKIGYLSSPSHPIP